MDEYIKHCLEGTEMIMETEKFALYVKKEEKVVHIYSKEEEDICEIPLNHLGDMSFK